MDEEIGPIIDYKQSKFMSFLRWAGKLILMLVATLYPVFAILALYHIPATLDRIYTTLGMTAALGILLRFCTTASTKEIFASTAT